MDKLKAKRGTQRRHITLLCNNVDSELKLTPPNASLLKILLQKLVTGHEKLASMDYEVMNYLVEGDADEALLDEEQEEASEYETKILTAKQGIETAVYPVQDVGTAVGGSHDGRGTTRQYKLPKVELKKFNGEIKNWLSWWAQFQKINDDNELHTTDKFQYLVQSIIPGTRAAQLVNSYPQTEDNYEKVIQALKERFGRESLLKHVYVRELQKLVMSSVLSKEAVKASTLYDKLESHLRALESLGIKSDVMSLFLFPFVESSLSNDLLIAWQRSPMSGLDGTQENPPVTELDLLMRFLKKEAENEDKRDIVHAGFESMSLTEKKKKVRSSQPDTSQEVVPTAAGLLTGKAEECPFCGKQGHSGESCWKAVKMPLSVKNDILKKKRRCFKCTSSGHRSRECAAKLKCELCGGAHLRVMCSQMPVNQTNQTVVEEKSNTEGGTGQDVSVNVNANQSCRSDVLLLTQLVRVSGQQGPLKVRIIFDHGSQTSHITTGVATAVGSAIVGESWNKSILFGGIVTEAKKVNHREVRLQGLDSNQGYRMILKERKTIVHGIPRVPRGTWIEDLKKKGIKISDLEGSPFDLDGIEILIGMDLMGKLMTGRTVKTGNGMIAMETVFGWTLGGPVKAATSLASTSINMIMSEFDIERFWRLEEMGIKDPIDKKTPDEADLQAKQHFEENVRRNEDGRYVVALPWVEKKENLPSNRLVAEKRLMNVTQRLQRNEEDYVKYDEVIQSWLEEGIIEEVQDLAQENVHYLPHRPVYKDSTTTPIRPVFDASCKVAGKPSLNECLYKGPNLIEEIPNVMLRFREKKVGVTADIRKAFQTIDVKEEDRNYLRFLWWTEKKAVKVLRHVRVVFGVNCSPYLLAAVIKVHLESVPDELKPVVGKFLKSLYVDNSVTSVDSCEQYQLYRETMTSLLADAQMVLRQWECSVGDATEISSHIDCGCGLVAGNNTLESTTNVLGLLWDKEKDVLKIDLPSGSDVEILTKRKLLSVIHRIYDPIGYTSPATIHLKIILQDVWKEKQKWDDELSEEVKDRFIKWYIEMDHLKQVEVPRCAMGSQLDTELHVFCDASKNAYAAVVYARYTVNNKVKVQLLLAKARVAPPKKCTIPRLELMACLVGARLCKTVVDALEWREVSITYWSDSSTALAWIRRNEDWGTFVGNRVRDVLKISRSEQWRFVPGVLNPADFPSRGCSPKELLHSRWWEGPSWLRNKDDWPTMEEKAEENVMTMEKKKTTASLAHVEAPLKSCWFGIRPLTEEGGEPEWYSSYNKNVRIMALVMRAAKKFKRKSDGAITVWPTIEEMKAGELMLLKIVQDDCFDPNLSSICGIQLLKMNGLLRVKTKLLNREDAEDFRFPIVLPRSHPLVALLIREAHLAHNHAGAQFLWSKLRQKYWILNGKRTIKSVIKACVPCRRYDAKHFEVEPASLPEYRVADAEVFDTTGVDLAGPVMLRDNSKAWIVLYTCAVYRCVHFDVVTSLSSEAFLGSLERFVNFYGRPTTVCSDNGTNFVGAAGLMRALDWPTLERKFKVKMIRWTFNPPTAAWWGGWWERLVRSMKNQLRRMLGSSRLTYDELRTCLSSVQATMNDRPITGMTDEDELLALTPAMFLHPSREAQFPEGVEIGPKEIRGSYKKMKRIQGSLQERFRREYLSLLVQRGKEKRCRVPEVGDVVLVGSEKKRFAWILGRVMEVIPGRDDNVRVARVKTAGGVLLRPIQRLFPLEVSSAAAIPVKKEVILAAKRTTEESKVDVGEIEEKAFTKFGREIKKPSRLGY